MKIAGSYGSLIRGVSQQAPEVRIDGQHTEQVNMLSDPVSGLTRRRGTIFKAAKALAQPASALDTFGGYRQIDHTTQGKDYVILLRDEASGVATASALPPIMCYNRTDNVWLDVSWQSAGQADKVNLDGVAAAVSIGRYLLFAVNNLACATTSTTVFGDNTKHKAVVFIRGGAYNRTYTVRTPAGTSFQYTTPDAAAAGSAAAISPAAIAASLVTAAVAAGVTGTSQNGSHFTFDTTYVAGQDVSVSDGGDNSLIRGVYATVDDVTKLPVMGINGQIVKVQTGPETWFYVQAFNKGAATLSETIWREAAGTVQGATLSNLGKGRIVGSTLYVGYSSAGTTGLDHMPPQPEPVPSLVPAQVGDAVTNVQHRWLSNQITYMGMFQDRLLVGSNAALSVSATGDYLNFYRSTTTTLPASDPFEMVAQGGEDDTLRHSVAYNKNLVLFGDKRQYIIGGGVALTPASPNMNVMTVYPDAAEAQPVAAGGQIFYARNREGSVNVHQIQPGAYVDSAESFPASAQISTYIPAPASNMEGVPGAPSLLALRTRSAPRSLYVFSYLDAPDGRKQDAWYRWEFNELCGSLLGVKSTPDGLLLLWARVQAGVVSLAADLMPLTTEAPTLPYLDSLRPAASIGDIAGWACAFDATTDRFLIGGDIVDDRAKLLTDYPAEAATLWAGLEFDSYIVPTNPFAKDKDGKALLNGRTVVTLLRVNTRASSGMAWELDAGGGIREGAFNGRRVGDPTNMVGTVPIISTIVTVPIGRETRAYTLKLKALRWFPLNLIGIEWTGQSFNRTPRA